MPPTVLTNLAPGQRAIVYSMPSSPDILNRLNELGLKEGEEIACDSIKQLYRFSHGKFMFNTALSEQILVDNIKSLSSNARSLSSNQ